jgi:hypothetical protein
MTDSEHASIVDFPSIDRLVDVLQQIYDQNGRRSAGSRASPLEPAAGPGIIGQVLGEAAGGYRDAGERLRALGRRGSDGQTERSGRYRELRSELDRIEAEAKRRAGAAENFLARKRPEPAAFYQETIYLRCRRFERSGGRFRCENLRGRKTEVRLASRSFTADAGDLIEQPQLRFSPERFVLDAGQSMVVGVEVDCSECSQTPIGALSGSADLLMDEAIALKLWIEVDVYDFP